MLTRRSLRELNITPRRAKKHKAMHKAVEAGAIHEVVI